MSTGSLILLLTFPIYVTSVISDVCVVGAGVGGLLTAIRLSNAGLRTTLLEKNEVIGGRLQSKTIYVANQSFRFDLGPSLLLLPSVYQETFKEVGEEIDNFFTILPVQPLYRCYFEEDNTYADIETLCGRESPAHSNNIYFSKMKRNLEQIEEGSYDRFLSYIKIATSFLNFGLPNIIKEQFNATYLFPFIQSCIKIFPLFSHYNMLTNFFRTPKLRAMFSFQDLYVGLSPHEAPGVFSLLQALELQEGIYYPEGGFGVVAKALESIALKSGVEILRNTEALAFQTNDDKTILSSVTSRSGSHPRNSTIVSVRASQFVLNVDAPRAEELFFSEDLRIIQDGRTAHGRPSCSVVSLHWALNLTLTPLLHHTIFLSRDYDRSWDCVGEFNSAFDPNAFNFYVHAPSRTDPSCCPSGMDAVTVLVPVSPLPDSDAPSSMNIDAIRSAVQRRMQIIDGMPKNFSEYIIHEEVATPQTWAQNYELYRGSAFGLTHSLTQLSLLRPRIRHPFLRNVCRVGASTRPGNGVPLVMIGSKLTAAACLQNLAKS